jgi:hypothetical protein
MHAPSYKKVEPWGLEVKIRKRKLHNLKVFFAKKKTHEQSKWQLEETY